MSILECKGLSKRFGAVTALDGISFTIFDYRSAGGAHPRHRIVGRDGDL